MSKTYLAAKLHGLAVTAARPDYHGSVTVDARLLGACGMEAFERVEVANMSTGARFSTYLLAGGDGACELNGAAARLGQVGDRLILMTYRQADAYSGGDVIEVDAANAPVARYRYVPGGAIESVEL